MYVTWSHCSQTLSLSLSCIQAQKSQLSLTVLPCSWCWCQHNWQVEERKPAVKEPTVTGSSIRSYSITSGRESWANIISGHWYARCIPWVFLVCDGVYQLLCPQVQDFVVLKYVQRQLWWSPTTHKTLSGKAMVLSCTFPRAVCHQAWSSAPSISTPLLQASMSFLTTTIWSVPSSGCAVNLGVFS